jgi:hypothetical protein
VGTEMAFKLKVIDLFPSESNGSRYSLWYPYLSGTGQMHRLASPEPGNSVGARLIQRYKRAAGALPSRSWHLSLKGSFSRVKPSNLRDSFHAMEQAA